MTFRKKAIVCSEAEYRLVRDKTRGGDGFPYSGPSSYPALILEASDPMAKPGEFHDKAYIIIEANDIRRILGVDDGR